MIHGEKKNAEKDCCGAENRSGGSMLISRDRMEKRLEIIKSYRSFIGEVNLPNDEQPVEQERKSKTA